MRLLPIYFFILLLSSSCGHIENKSPEIITTTDSIIKDIPRFSDSNAVVLTYDTSESGSYLYRSLSFQNVVSTSLSIKEINELDSLTWEVIKETRAKSFNLPHYKRQYVPVFDDKGEKIVWINYLCWLNDFEWKELPLIATDGGDCYFNLTINLKTKKCIAYVGGGGG